jgi:hypothetical protein
MQDCEQQMTFNNIVDIKQRVMGLLLDNTGDEDSEVSKFLFVTKASFICCTFAGCAPEPSMRGRDNGGTGEV